MKAYQEKYVENLKLIMSLSGAPEEIPEDIGRFMQERRKRNAEIAAIAEENTELLRRNLMPVLDDIVSASEEETAQLEDFAAHLLQGAKYLDLLLNYMIRNALVAYARKHEDRNMLIRQLYHTGMALYYMQQIISHADRNDYRWKMSMLFGEAASCIKKYDEIRDADTRGYIHRAMANLALSYSWTIPEEADRKIRAIRRSFQVLTDPRYHEKTPELPWDLYLYKSHQERTTAMQLLRLGEADSLIVREVMESAEFVWKKQLENSRKKGVRPSLRWMLEYDIAQYHCGILDLFQLLNRMERAYMDREENDFSMNGIWNHIYLPAFYAVYMTDDPSMVRKKKKVLLFMYGKMVDYVQRTPNNQLNGTLIDSLLQSFKSFIEYPDGIQARDFLLDLVVCRDPDVYVYLNLTANISRMIMEEALERIPEELAGMPGREDIPRAGAEELLGFTYECGMLHDIGTFLFSSLVTLSARSRLQEEEKMYTCHVYAGEQILSRFQSTKKYMPAALGHHRWYDGEGGYPEEYHREEDPCRQVTDVVAIASFLAGLLDSRFNDEKAEHSLKEALARVEQGAGTRFSPAFAALLPKMEEKLEAYLERGAAEAYEKAFQMLRGDRGKLS